MVQLQGRRLYLCFAFPIRAGKRAALSINEIQNKAFYLIDHAYYLNSIDLVKRVDLGKLLRFGRRVLREESTVIPSH